MCQLSREQGLQTLREASRRYPWRMSAVIVEQTSSKAEAGRHDSLCLAEHSRIKESHLGRGSHLRWKRCEKGMEKPSNCCFFDIFWRSALKQ